MKEGAICMTKAWSISNAMMMCKGMCMYSALSCVRQG